MAINEAFSPFRAIGNLCDDVPASLTLLYGKPVLMVATGRTFQLFRGIELSLLRGGPVFENAVRAVAHCGKLRFVAEGAVIHAFVHHKPLWTAPHAPLSRAPATHLLAVDDFLFSAGEDKKIVAWIAKTGERVADWVVAQNSRVSALVVPAGYTNKLLVGTLEGHVHLYNFRTKECLFVSTCPFGGPVTALASSRYRDLVAVGGGDGTVTVFNFGTDTAVAAFSHEGGSVTTVHFRQDTDGVLCSGSSLGEVALWDLGGRRLAGVIARTKQVRSRDDATESAHADAVHTVAFYPGMPLLVTLGADNAICQHRLDTVDGLALMVRERRGHVGECTDAVFYNPDLVLTSGRDRALRCTHVFSDRASWEMSQGKLGKKSRELHVQRETLRLPPAVAIAAHPARNYQWSSVLTIHEASAHVCGWKMDRRALDLKLAPVITGVHCCRSVAISHCGNFAFLGYSSGSLVRVNLQSEQLLHFGRPASGTEEIKHHGNKAFTPILAHAASVEGVAVAGWNADVLSFGLDSCIKVWDLLSGTLRRVLRTGFAHRKGAVHAEASLLAVSCSDHVIRMYSCAANSGSSMLVEDAAPPAAAGAAAALAVPARTFVGHAAPVTAVSITPDTGRHLVSASSDAVLAVWDIAVGHCVGIYRVASPATSLAFHPDGLFLLSAHAGERGAFLWTNNLRYGFAPDAVDAAARVAAAAVPGGEPLPLLHFPHAKEEAAEDDAADAGAALGGGADLAEDAEPGGGEHTGEAGAGSASAAPAGAKRPRYSDAGAGGGASAAAPAAAAVTGVEATADNARGYGRVAGAGGDDAVLFDPATDVAQAARRRADAEAQRLAALPVAGMARSGWSAAALGALPALDRIRERNQPLLPPKKENVPFFLATTRELRPTFIVRSTGDGTAGTRSAADAAGDDDPAAAFRAALAAGDAAAALAALVALRNPSAVDLALRRLVVSPEEALSGAAAPPGAGPLGAVVPSAEERAQDAALLAEDTAMLARCLDFFSAALRGRQAVDFVQAALALFLKMHGAAVVHLGGGGGGAGNGAGNGAAAALGLALGRVLEAQREVRAEAASLVDYPVCLVSTFANAFA